MRVVQKTIQRRQRIVDLIATQRFITAEKLSEILEISIASVRRDLTELAREGKIERVHGGATVRAAGISAEKDNPCANAVPIEGEAALTEHVDALIMTVIDPSNDTHIVESLKRKCKPIIAESLVGYLDVPVVKVDNYQAGYDIGCWAARYAQTHWGGRANILNLTYHLENTQERSSGFMDGIHSELPGTEEVYKLNTQSNAEIAYQLARDALVAYPQINIIFAINDTNAFGAIRACQELNIAPENIMVIPFGIEGSTFRTLLQENRYVKAGIAMFPEVVARICLLAALKSIAGETIPHHLTTPYKVLTSENLREYYHLQDDHWALRWERIMAEADLPLDPLAKPDQQFLHSKIKVGVMVRYRAHEWYQSLVRTMQEDAAAFGVSLEIYDGDLPIRYELSQRRTEIAFEAEKLVRPGSVIVVDGGPLARYFAQRLAEAAHLTGLRVITNSLEVLNILQGNSNIMVMCTGGVLRRDRPYMVGLTAEESLRNLRADQVFLAVSGISPAFGLSHDDISEVSVKQAMMQAGREVILLADHTCFGRESFIHFSPIKHVHKIITDETLPASLRLELAQQGIEVLVAN